MLYSIAHTKLQSMHIANLWREKLVQMRHVRQRERSERKQKFNKLKTEIWGAIKKNLFRE